MDKNWFKICSEHLLIFNIILFLTKCKVAENFGASRGGQQMNWQEGGNVQIGNQCSAPVQTLLYN